MTKTSRHVAFDILLDVYKNKSYANLALKEKLRGVPAVDTGLITNIVYGVLQNMILIDYYISFYTKGKRVKPNIRVILQIGIYQILFLDKIPDNASVNEAVKLTRKLKLDGLSGFVNGVLRNIARNKDNLPEIKGSENEILAIKYSHPLWLIEKLISEFGLSETELILIENNKKAPLVCRVNTLKTGNVEIENAFASDVIENAIILEKSGDITKLDAFENGEIYVQDLASQLAIKALNPKPNSIVVDVCSAPGGKSFLSAQYMQNKGIIHSFDIFEHKIELINQTAEKMGIDIIKSEVFDANNTKEELLGKADFVICDVPCSGLGIIRRKPEIRFKEDIEKLPEIGYNILNSASKYLKKGGELLFSTCTIIKQENDEVLYKFLENNSDFELVDFEILNVKQSSITLLSHKNGTDGFFISKIRRK